MLERVIPNGCLCLFHITESFLRLSPIVRLENALIHLDCFPAIQMSKYMKSPPSSTLALVVIFNSFLPSNGHALPIPVSPTDAEDLNELIIQTENLQDLSGPDIDELRTDLTRGLYDSVLNKIATKYHKEALNTDVLTIKIAALIGSKEFTSARKEMAYFDKGKGMPEESILLIGSMYRKVGKALDALKISQQGLAANINSPKLLFMMGRIYDSMGQSKTALIYYERSAELDQLKKSLPAGALTESIANSYMKLKKLAEAKDVFTNEADAQPESLIKEIAFAKYYASRREYKKSLDLLDNITATNNAHAPVIIKAQVLNLAGKPKLAIEHLAKLKQQNPSSYPVVSVELTEAMSHLLTNFPQKSLAAVNRAGFSEKRPANIELVLATINLSLGDVQSATEALRRAPVPFPEIAGIGSLQAHLKSPSLGPVIGLAYFCLDQGYYQQALETAKAGLVKHPGNIFLHFILAETYRQTGQYKMALSEFKRLNTIMPESFSFRFLLAKTYEEAGMDQQALKRYAALSKERPDFLLTQLAYGKLLEGSGEWEKARNAYEWSLNFKPDSVPLLVALGWALIHSRDFEALAPVLSTLKTNDKANPGLVLHLEGWAAYQQKDRPRAVELLAQALAETPGNPEVCYHLGMAYGATGDKQKAINLLQQAFLFPEQAEKYRKQ